jgi:amidase
LIKIFNFNQLGCLILGRTNLSEWAYAFTENVPSGFSAVGGQCLHPDDIHEDVSGSSSGSAAGIKLNLFTFSLGTETQGSLLSPAINVRDVCALKPSLGTWPNEDIIPVNYEQDSCGPMARTIQDVELLHRIVSRTKEKIDISSRTLRVGYLGKLNQKKTNIISILIALHFFFVIGQSQDGIVLLRTLSALLPLTTLIDLNYDEFLVKPIESILNPSAICNISFVDFLCYALARDIPSYLSSHSSFYSHQTLNSIIEWNSSHPEYIPYGQSLFLRAIQSPITEENYNKYKQTIKESFQSIVDYLQSTYSLDCLLTIGNDDMFCGTTICGIPRANLTLDYYNPDHQQINVVAVGLSLHDDYLLLRLLHRLEKANLQAGKIDTRTRFEKYIQHPIKSAYRMVVQFYK